MLEDSSKGSLARHARALCLVLQVLLANDAVGAAVVHDDELLGGANSFNEVGFGINPGDAAHTYTCNYKGRLLYTLSLS